MSSTTRSTCQDRWLNFFNNVVYDTLPGLYNAIDWLSFGIWWRLVRRALDYVPAGGQVLEVGFGPGKLLVRLAGQTDLCAGIDRALGMCRFARRRLQQHGLRSYICCGNVCSLPYPDRTFDAVVSTLAFAGFSDGECAMREMARVTAPGGCVVLIDIGLPSNGNSFGTFWARLWERVGDFLYDQPALMRQAGLTVTLYEEFGPGDHIRAVVGEKPLSPVPLT